MKRGFFNADGKICLFLNADGSVGPKEIGKNLHYILDKDYDIFVGSRVLRGQGQILNTKWYRKFIGAIFKIFVQLVLISCVKDTQCGFKMFKKETIKPLFSKSRFRGFSFDLEILYLAYNMGYKIKEGPVSWQYINNSKINFFKDPIRMFIDIFLIKNRHHLLRQKDKLCVIGKNNNQKTNSIRKLRLF